MIEELIKRVTRASLINEEAKKMWDVGQDIQYGKCAAYSLEDAAGNHAFDDYPEAFGITEQEGHQIRAYFQQRGCRYDDAHRDQINALIGAVWAAGWLKDRLKGAESL